MVSASMEFYTFPMFYDNIDNIKEEYNNLKISNKYVYKYYIYSRRELSERMCDIIWEYLNSYDVFEICELKRILYRERKRYD